jgi:hypothetical protein
METITILDIYKNAANARHEKFDVATQIDHMVANHFLKSYKREEKNIRSGH